MEEEEEGKEKDESEAVSSVMSDNESLTWVREGRGKRGGRGRKAEVTGGQTRLPGAS